MTSFATEWESNSSTISTSSFSSLAALLSPTSFFFLWVYVRINTQTHTHSHRFKCTKWRRDDSQKLGCRYSRIDDSSLTRSWSLRRERCHNKPALSSHAEARRSCKHTLLRAHTSTPPHASCCDKPLSQQEGLSAPDKVHTCKLLRMISRT